MKLFECQNCGQLLHFENTRCESCGMALGFIAERQVLTAIAPDAGNGISTAAAPGAALSGVFRALAEPERRFRACANTIHGSCNWLVAEDAPETFCEACRHNRMIPDLSLLQNLTQYRKIEYAKHRLFYSLIRFKLPLRTKLQDAEGGLAFDFLSNDAPTPTGTQVMTGHENGLITINLNEADDAVREKLRSDMGEPYRTLLGHFRHEVAHYYWEVLIANSPVIDDYRAVFGDEREDYGEALKRHYANGPRPDWPDHFVSSYASSHSWEDFAETWAHYFHMVDTVETARSYGLSVRPRVGHGTDLSVTIDFDPYNADIDRLIDAWLPLTVAMNSINRSMGQPDLYPFVLTPSVIVKLSFIHNRIHAGDWKRRGSNDDGLKAIVAGLKRNIRAPTH